MNDTDVIYWPRFYISLIVDTQNKANDRIIGTNINNGIRIPDSSGRYNSDTDDESTIKGDGDTENGIIDDFSLSVPTATRRDSAKSHTKSITNIRWPCLNFALNTVRNEYLKMSRNT